MLKKFEDVYTNLDSVTMIITNRCNLACHYCFEKDKGTENMDIQTAIDIVDKTYNPRANMKQRFTYNLFGGEPMVNWPVVKAILDRINEKNYNAQVGITTNMTHLTDEMLEYIDDNDVFLLVSIDGIKEVHDRHRVDHAGHGSFDTVMKNLNTLIENDLTHLIEARLTITPETVDYLFDSVKMLIDLGINNICPIPASDLDWPEEALEKFRVNYRKMLDLYVEILNDKNNTRNISIKHIDDIVGQVLEKEVTDTKMCHIASPKWLCIDWKADIYPCHNFPTTNLDFLKEMKIGNLYTGVDESRITPKALYAKFELDRCDGCPAKIICKSGCPFQNYTENGDFFTPTKAYCDLEVVIFEEAIKFREKLLTAENIRSRKLNILIENLKVKKYFDEELSNVSDLGLEFRMKLDRFLELYNNLKMSDNIIPSFDQFYSARLGMLMAVMAGMLGKKIVINDDGTQTMEETE